MIETFVEKYAQKIVTKPECIKVQSRTDKDSKGLSFKEICIFAHSSDVGRLIGKEGKMIGSLKTVISGAKAKDGQNYKIIIKTAQQ